MTMQSLKDNNITSRSMSSYQTITSDSKHPHIGCVIMASGFGRRFGENKLMAPLLGEPVISYILKTVKELPEFSVVVVTRYESVETLCRQLSTPVLLHNMPDKNDTIRLGLQYLLNQHKDTLKGCMFCTGDQPLLKKESLTAMAKAFAQSCHNIYRLSYENISSNPVLFDRFYFDALLCLPKGKGGNYIVKQNPEQVIEISARDKYELYDIDTTHDMDVIKSHLASL